MTVTMMIVFGSAFFTDVIGVHAIFGLSYLVSYSITPILLLDSQGAFVTGLIVPREGGLAITITEKLEDMVSIIFLPLVNTLLCFRDRFSTITRIHSSTSHFPVSRLISHCWTMVIFRHLSLNTSAMIYYSHHLGLYNRHNHYRICWQVRRMHGCSALFRRFQLARIEYYRFSDEL